MKTLIYPVKDTNYDRFEVGYVNDIKIHVYAEDKFYGKANIQLTSIEQVKNLYEALGKVISASQTVEKYHLTTFGFDGMDKGWLGYSANQYWNGWAVPYFTKEVVEQIMDHLELDDMGVTWYCAENDTYYYYIDGNTIEDYELVYETKGTDIIVDGETVHVYDIGDGWTWMEDFDEE